MNLAPASLLIAAVAAVGVLHTMVPDHWVPIALIGRERGWSKTETARAAAVAGTGHVLSTLVIALAVWIAGAAFAARFGNVVDLAASLALIGFGGWIAIAAWRELDHAGPPHRHSKDHGQRLCHNHGHRHVDHHHDQHQHYGDPIVDEPHRNDMAYAAAVPGWAAEDDPLFVPLRGVTAAPIRHAHLHRHGGGPAHLHWHDHAPATAHPLLAGLAVEPPLHRHRHKTTARTALLLILGSSPMVEGIPAFFAAAKFGAVIIATMASVFALSTIATYVGLSVSSSAGLQRLRFGSLDRYGEVLSGAVIALTGIVFGLWPSL